MISFCLLINSLLFSLKLGKEAGLFLGSESCQLCEPCLLDELGCLICFTLFLGQTGGLSLSLASFLLFSGLFFFLFKLSQFCL